MSWQSYAFLLTMAKKTADIFANTKIYHYFCTILREYYEKLQKEAKTNNKTKQSNDKEIEYEDEELNTDNFEFSDEEENNSIQEENFGDDLIS